VADRRGPPPIENPPVEIVLSVVTGYAAYLPAELVGASGSWPR
jgi:hypothetical protein